MRECGWGAEERSDEDCDRSNAIFTTIAGTVVAHQTTVNIVINSITNMQFEGPSGVYPLLKTTLADGTTAIDESR